MRFLVFLSFMTLSIHGFAEVGKVINLIGQDSYLIRADKKIPLQIDLELELADKVSSQNSVVVLYLAPSSQLSLSKNSEIQITESLIKEGEDLTKTDSIIDLIQGLIRLQVVGDSGIEVTQKIRTKDVSFGVRGTDFEVNLEEDEVSLDVYEGEVEVTSPHVNTFVPYYVKGSEGFRYGRKKHLFEKKKFSPRFREAGFKKREEIRERWQKRRNKIKARKKLQGRRKMMKKTGRRQRTPRRKK